MTSLEGRRTVVVTDAAGGIGAAVTIGALSARTVILRWLTRRARGAVRALTRAANLEFGAARIRVNAVREIAVDGGASGHAVAKTIADAMRPSYF